jgi:assimilatory nitrate reductase electron transfer subunit
MRSKSESAPHRVVVVGGGMAGTRLAHQLVSASQSGLAASDATGAAVEVTVIGEEPHPAYNRVLLAEVLAGRYAPEVIALPVPAGARCLGGVRAVEIDRHAAEVRCDDGRRVAYDTLVLATGSNPVLPPLRGLFAPDGHDLPAGVHAFRTMDDCLALAAAVRPGVRAVVIGGGLLGVSAARALVQRGAQVVLAQQGEHLMERHLDAQASALLRRHVEALGVEVHAECRVRGLRTVPAPAASGTSAPADPTAATAAPTPAPADGAPRRAVSAVELADGYTLDADLVVLACGVRPRVKLALDAGLDVARGVVVDDRLRTSDPAVYAIGDCAEHDGIVYGLAGPAQEQADLLAQVLATRIGHTANGSAPNAPTANGRTGNSPAHDSPADTPAIPMTTAGGRPDPAPAAPRYTGTRSITRLTLATDGPGPLDLAAFGETIPAPGDDVVHLADATRNSYRKVVVRGDRLVGGILVGDLGTVGELARAWADDEPLSFASKAPLLHLLTPRSH